MWAFLEIPVVTARGIERWHMRSFRHRPPSYADVRRTAMVRSIVVDEAVVHWIETEPRGPGDRQHSLVFAQNGEAHLTTVVTGLLKLAAEARGVWPNPAALPGLERPEGRTGVRRAAVWRHTEGGAAPDLGAASGPVLAAAPFNRRSALAAILDVALG